jgi:exosortase/archaeosortase family protein
VARKGALLHLSHADLLVGSICAGENHIAAMLVLLALATMLFSLTLPQKLWFAGSAIVVGFSCNAVRIAALAVFADRGQMERFTSWHDGQLSPLCMGIAALLTLGLWWPVLRRAPAAPQ